MRPLCHTPPHLGLGVPAQRLCSTPDHSGQSAPTGRTGGAPGGRGAGSSSSTQHRAGDHEERIGAVAGGLSGDHGSPVLREEREGIALADNRPTGELEVGAQAQVHELRNPEVSPCFPTSALLVPTNKVVG